MFRRRTASVDQPGAGREPARAQEPVAAREPATAQEPVAGREPVAAREPAAGRGAAAGGGGAVAGAAAAGTTAVGTLFVAIARLVRIIAGLIFLLIVIEIVLFDAKANQSNSIVKGIHNAAHFFASPFTGIFSVHGLRTEHTLNWGIAAIVYLIAGAIIAAIIATPGHGLRRVGRRPRRV